MHHARRGLRRPLEHEGRRYHREYRGREHVLVEVVPEHAVVASHVHQDKREFSDLRQAQSNYYRKPQGIAEHLSDADYYEGLYDKYGEGDKEELGHVRREVFEFEEHAHGDEKERAERVPERQDLGDYLVRVLAFRNNKPGHECAEGERQAGQRREPRRSEADENYRQYEDLAVTELDDLVKEFRYDV